MLRALYLTLVPKSIVKFKSKLKEDFYWNKRGRSVKKQILDKYKNVPDKDIPSDYLKIINFLRKKPIQLMCYNFVENYKPSDIQIFYDSTIGLNYAMYADKKLYFKKSWSSKKIKEYYSYLLAEQDKESPHKYLSPNFDIVDKAIVIDAGAAEGIFALSIIEKVSKIYLFEPEQEWIEALKATFLPWKDKVEIIDKYLGQINTPETVSIDEYFKNNNKVDFIKIDVEGYEQDVLIGAEGIMSSNPTLQIAVCTYHKQNDEIILAEYLKTKSFAISYSDGYIVFFYDKEIKAPFFRRCMIRATRV